MSTGSKDPFLRVSRRPFLQRSLWSTLALTGAGMFLSLFEECNLPRVYRVAVPRRTLPDMLPGFIICQLSDLHRSPVISEEHLRRGAALAMSLRPDLIAVTGDFVSDSAQNK